MTRSILIITFITILLFHVHPPDVYCQIAEIASLVTSILGGAGNGAAIGNAAAAGAGAANAIGNLGALYQLAQTAMQLTGTGVGIANQAAESQWFPVVVEQAAKNHRMMTERLAAFNSGRIVNPLSLGGTDGFGSTVTSYYKTTTESTLPSEYGSKIVITETTEHPKTSKIKLDLTKVDKEDNVEEYEEEEEEDKDKSGSGYKKEEEYEEEINNRVDVDNGENIDGSNENLIKNENKSITNSKSNKSKSKKSEEDSDIDEENIKTIKKLMKILKQSNLKESEFEEIEKQLIKNTNKNKKDDIKITTIPTTTQKSTTSTQKPTTTTEEDYTSEERNESEERRRIIEETKRSLGRRTTILQKMTSLNPKHVTLIKLISTTPLPDSEKIFPIPLSQAIKSDNNKPGEIIENNKFLTTTTIKSQIVEKPHIILVKPESSMYKDPQGGVPIESVKKTPKRIFTATIPINHGNNIKISNSQNEITNHQLPNINYINKNGRVFQQETFKPNPENFTLKQINKNSHIGQSNIINEKNKQSFNNVQNGNFVRFNGATTFNSNSQMPLKTISNVNVPYQQNINNRQPLPYQNNNYNNNQINRLPQNYYNGLNYNKESGKTSSQGYNHQLNVPYNNGYQNQYKPQVNQYQQWTGYTNNYQPNQYYHNYNQINTIPSNNINSYTTNQQNQQREIWRNGR
ncbi:Hypothetical protein SRAE_2000379400 [Strongyloides ratti]|uniref:Uncharacterized protein n=1 Tax=Strongyloides ratti TaxID=34506 RepID=A0A090LLV2_STRRB|nr:Hypothetical protein SRAE_2000379400 [Strongyloides ratti]CEF69143.1 Hypothetical protein SRAE_2000379400 [Strongyloides ratti]